MAKTYKDAGVDIEKGDRFAQFIGSLNSKAIPSNIGGFAGGMEIDLKKYRNPVMLSCTDGVGTKLLVSQKLKRFDTVGIDLVAMSVNDLIVCGAEPITFLDYIACGSLKEEILQDVVKGIVKGCEDSECTLSGGETAEMPDLYKGDDFDLAGFCVGLVEKSEMLPKKESINEGDIIFALPSVGIHSNGLSLARKAIPENDTALMNELLKPTKIYVKDMKPLLKTQKIKGAAHITGGGLEANFQRVLPNGLTSQFSWDWPVPSIFNAIQEKGGIETEEMRKVFNMGIGIAFAAAPEDKEMILSAASEAGIAIFEAGKIVRG